MPSPRPTPRGLASAAWLAVPFALAWMVALPTARAYDRQAGLFATAGYTGIVGDTPYPPHAFTAGIGVGFGLDDVWELRVRADYALHPSSLHRITGSADLVYLIDVLSAVPYLGVSVGGAVSILDAALGLGSVRGDFVAGALGGLDVLLGRSWTIGAELRVGWVVTDFDREPMQISGLVRAQTLFEL